MRLLAQQRCLAAEEILRDLFAKFSHMYDTASFRDHGTASKVLHLIGVEDSRIFHEPWIAIAVNNDWSAQDSRVVGNIYVLNCLELFQVICHWLTCYLSAPWQWMMEYYSAVLYQHHNLPSLPICEDHKSVDLLLHRELKNIWLGLMKHGTARWSRSTRPTRGI